MDNITVENGSVNYLKDKEEMYQIIGKSKKVR